MLTVLLGTIMMLFIQHLGFLFFMGDSEVHTLLFVVFYINMNIQIYFYFNMWLYFYFDSRLVLQFDLLCSPLQNVPAPLFTDPNEVAQYLTLKMTECEKLELPVLQTHTADKVIE